MLLVDDSDLILERAAAALGGTCTLVGAVRNGLAAIEAVASLRPDVVVLDISIPGGLSGFEVASRIRKSGSTVAIVFLSVHDEEEFVTAAQAKGGLGYVVKPQLTSDLAVAVREAHAGRPYVSRS